MTTVKQVCAVCGGRGSTPRRESDSWVVWEQCVFCQGLGAIDVEDPPPPTEEKELND